MTSLRRWSPPSLEKIVSLSLADRAVEFFQHGHHVFPNFAFLTRRLVAQQIRRVIRNHEWGVVIGMPFATQLAHHAARAEQTFHRRCAQRDHYARLNDFDLLNEIADAGLHFLWRRRTISGRALRHVGTAF